MNVNTPHPTRPDPATYACFQKRARLLAWFSPRWLQHVGEQSQQAVMLQTVLDLLVRARHSCYYTARSSPSGGNSRAQARRKSRVQERGNSRAQASGRPAWWSLITGLCTMIAPIFSSLSKEEDEVDDEDEWVTIIFLLTGPTVIRCELLKSALGVVLHRLLLPWRSIKAQAEGRLLRLISLGRVCA